MAREHRTLQKTAQSESFRGLHNKLVSCVCLYIVGSRYGSRRKAAFFALLLWSVLHPTILVNKPSFIHSFVRATSRTRWQKFSVTWTRMLYRSQTCRSLSTRIKEHQTDLKNLNLDSATTQHAVDKATKLITIMPGLWIPVVNGTNASKWNLCTHRIDKFYHEPEGRDKRAWRIPKAF